MSRTGKYLLATVIALSTASLASCAAPVPSPPPTDGFYVEKEPPPPVHRQPPSSPATLAPLPAGEASATPGPPQPGGAGQLPAAAQPPTVIAPPAGVPSDAFQYIEPPSR